MDAMKIIHEPRAMQRTATALREGGKRIAFVPTMGYLHEGHLSLMREGRKRADVLVASVFVNPTQFGPNEDLEAYPRDIERDRRLMREVGVNILFLPTEETMYGEGYQTYVTVEKVTRGLCGRSRPVHFRGVATVVLKLFNIVKPHVALFGMKDFQQLVVIQTMVRDLNLEVEVVGCPTVREPDGLAMSSRNAYLHAEERQEALAIKKALDAAWERYQAGERNAAVLVSVARQVLEAHPGVRPDYVQLCDTRTLEDVERLEGETILAIAAFVGKTRLLDNHIFPAPGESASRSTGRGNVGRSAGGAP